MLWAFRIVSALVVMTAPYVWTVGQAGLETANKNICELATSVLPFSNCHVQHLYVGAWIIGFLAAVGFILFDLARIIHRAVLRGKSTEDPSAPSVSARPRASRKTVPDVVSKAVRPLTPYEAEKKIRVIDSILKVLREDMQPLEDKWYLPQVGHAWNAFKDPQNKQDYLSQVFAYRDSFRTICEGLVSFRHSNAEYPDILAASDQPNYETELKAIENYLILSQQFLSYLMPDIGFDDFSRMLNPASADALKATHEFKYWRTQTRIKMEQMRVALQSDTQEATN
jgi:hypothetical protein